MLKKNVFFFFVCDVIKIQSCDSVAELVNKVYNAN